MKHKEHKGTEEQGEKPCFFFPAEISGPQNSEVIVPIRDGRNEDTKPTVRSGRDFFFINVWKARREKSRSQTSKGKQRSTAFVGQTKQASTGAGNRSQAKAKRRAAPGTPPKQGHPKGTRDGNKHPQNRNTAANQTSRHGGSRFFGKGKEDIRGG